MKKSIFVVLALLVGLSMICSRHAPPQLPQKPLTAAANPGLQMESAKVAPQFFNDKDYASQQGI